MRLTQKSTKFHKTVKVPKSTKTKLLSNGKLLNESTRQYLEDQDSEGEDIEQPFELPQKHNNHRTEQESIYNEQFTHKENKLKISNMRFRWRQMFGTYIQDQQMLTQLTLSSCENTLQNISELASLKWPNLKSLTINQYYDFYSQIRVRMTDFQIERLVENQWPALEKLDLEDNQIGDSGLEILLESAFMPNLKYLDIGRNNITQHGVNSILNMSNMSNLTFLSLQFNCIRSTGVKLLIKADLPNLQTLRLAYCGIENEGVKHITKGNWPQLTNITLNGGNRISMSGYEAVSLNNWPKLKQYNQTESDCTCCYGQFQRFSGIGTESFDIAVFALMINCQQASLWCYSTWPSRDSQVQTILFNLYQDRGRSRQRD